MIKLGMLGTVLVVACGSESSAVRGGDASADALAGGGGSPSGGHTADAAAAGTNNGSGGTTRSGSGGATRNGSGGTSSGGSGAAQSGGYGGIATDGGAAMDGGARRRRPFPDTTSKIAILTDQLPNLNDAQRRFVVAHYVGTEKQTLEQSRPLRALAPDFLVLHYHLSMWQSAPATTFIVDGQHWGNDYPTVTTHENWFWHDTQNRRVASTADQKLLMNISDVGWQDYLAGSLAMQVDAGDYDGIFFDSASPALLQAEVGAQDTRLAGTGARDTKLAELGNQTFIQAWQMWMFGLNAVLGNAGIPLIPNTSAFVTTWDDTDYGMTAGAFVEGFADPGWAASDWKASTNELLSLASKHKILILQNYLNDSSDVARRLYYLANYLLVKGDKTYLEYFAGGPFEWYPEWKLDLGAPMKAATTVDDLAAGGAYRRDFERGIVLVNPTGSAVDVALGGTFRRVAPSGGGAVDANGTEPGSIATSPVTSVTVAAHGGEVLLR